MKKNVILGQSGGPTAVINASLAGVYKTAKDMGADIIIGVDLGTSDLKQLERINTPWDIVGQIVALHGYEKYGPNKEQTDLLFRPNTDPYNSASFGETALDTLIDRGEQSPASNGMRFLP